MASLRDPEVVMDELNVLRGKIYALEHEFSAASNPVIRRAVELANEIDPNWRKVCVWDYRETKKTKNGELVFAAPPDLQVYMNGPAHGDVVLTDEVKDLLTPKFLAEIRANRGGVYDGPEFFICYMNPNHRWELEVKRVVFDMENCDTAYLSAINPDGSFVVKSTEPDFEACEWLYTVDRLNDDMANPVDDNGQRDIVDVSYVPFRLEQSVYGHRVFQSVEEFSAAQKQWQKDQQENTRQTEGRSNNEE